MGPVEWTSVAGVVVALLVGMVVPGITERRKTRSTGDATALDSWDKMVARMQQEIARQQEDLARQQAELDGIDAKYKARLSAMESEYTAKLAAAQAEIAGLRVELETFRRVLRGQVPPTNP